MKDLQAMIAELKQKSLNLKVGDSVFHNCLNPATGVIKRMAKNRVWADVAWNDGSNIIRTNRVYMERLRPLCDALNFFTTRY